MGQGTDTAGHRRRKISTFTPSMLAAFERCPHQYFLRYVQKLRPPEPFNPAFARGNAAHEVLRQSFEHYRRLRAFPIDLRGRVEAQLPRPPYADERAWAADVEKVLGWVRWALAAFDGSARVLAAERWFEYRFPGNAGCAPFRLRHRVDLALEHEDGSVEHLDWKGGDGYRVDALQNVAARIVVGRAFPDRPRIRSSTAFLANEAARTDELTYDEVKADWGRIKELAGAIMAERDWLPVSNPLCPWCPFYGQGCPIYPAGEEPDAMTGWLEESA